MPTSIPAYAVLDFLEKSELDANGKQMLLDQWRTDEKDQIEAVRGLFKDEKDKLISQIDDHYLRATALLGGKKTTGDFKLWAGKIPKAIATGASDALYGGASIVASAIAAGDRLIDEESVDPRDTETRRLTPSEYAAYTNYGTFYDRERVSNEIAENMSPMRRRQNSIFQDPGTGRYYIRKPVEGVADRLRSGEFTPPSENELYQSNKAEEMADRQLGQRMDIEAAIPDPSYLIKAHEGPIFGKTQAKKAIIDLQAELNEIKAIDTSGFTVDRKASLESIKSEITDEMDRLRRVDEKEGSFGARIKRLGIITAGTAIEAGTQMTIAGGMAAAGRGAALKNAATAKLTRDIVANRVALQLTAQQVGASHAERVRRLQDTADSTHGAAFLKTLAEAPATIFLERAGVKGILEGPTGAARRAMSAGRREAGTEIAQSAVSELLNTGVPDTPELLAKHAETAAISGATGGLVGGVLGGITGTVDSKASLGGRTAAQIAQDEVLGEHERSRPAPNVRPGPWNVLTESEDRRARANGQQVVYDTRTADEIVSDGTSFRVATSDNKLAKLEAAMKAQPGTVGVVSNMDAVLNDPAASNEVRAHRRAAVQLATMAQAMSGTKTVFVRGLHAAEGYGGISHKGVSYVDIDSPDGIARVTAEEWFHDIENQIDALAASDNTVDSKAGEDARAALDLILENVKKDSAGYKGVKAEYGAKPKSGETDTDTGDNDKVVSSELLARLFVDSAPRKAFLKKFAGDSKNRGLVRLMYDSISNIYHKFRDGLHGFWHTANESELSAIEQAFNDIDAVRDMLVEAVGTVGRTRIQKGSEAASRGVERESVLTDIDVDEVVGDAPIADRADRTKQIQTRLERLRFETQNLDHWLRRYDRNSSPGVHSRLTNAIRNVEAAEARLMDFSEDRKDRVVTGIQNILNEINFSPAVFRASEGVLGIADIAESFEGTPSHDVVSEAERQAAQEVRQKSLARWQAENEAIKDQQKLEEAVALELSEQKRVKRNADARQRRLNKIIADTNKRIKEDEVARSKVEVSRQQAREGVRQAAIAGEVGVKPTPITVDSEVADEISERAGKRQAPQYSGETRGVQELDAEAVRDVELQRQAAREAGRTYDPSIPISSRVAAAKSADLIARAEAVEGVSPEEKQEITDAARRARFNRPLNFTVNSDGSIDADGPTKQEIENTGLAHVLRNRDLRGFAAMLQGASTLVKGVSNKAGNFLRIEVNNARIDRLNEYLNGVSPFMAKSHKVMKSIGDKARREVERAAFKMATGSGKKGAAWVGKFIERHDLSAEYKQFRATMDKMRTDLERDGGREDIGYIDNYFPRTVKPSQIDNFLHAVDKYSPELAAAMRNHSMFSTSPHYALMSMLRDAGPGKPVNLKERDIDFMTADLERYYEDPIRSIGKYINDVVLDITRRQFMGDVDIDDFQATVDSIMDGSENADNEVKRRIEDSKFIKLVLEDNPHPTPSQLADLRDAMRLAWKPSGASRASQLISTVTYATLVAQVGSMFKQVSNDIGLSLLKNGIPATAMTIARRTANKFGAGKNQLTGQNTRLVYDALADLVKEYHGVNAVGHFALKQTLGRVDIGGKMTFAESTIRKIQSDLKAGKKDSPHIRTVSRTLEGANQKPISEVLEEIKNLDWADPSKPFSSDVTNLAMAAVLKYHPATQFETPKFVKSTPKDLRWVTALWSYWAKGLMQAKESMLDDVAAGIATNSKERVKRGLYHMVSYGAAMGLSGMAALAIKDLFDDRDERDGRYFLEFMTGFLRTWAVDRMPGSGVTKGFIEKITPAFFSVIMKYKDMLSDLNDKDKSAGDIFSENADIVPVAGEAMAWGFDKLTDRDFGIKKSAAAELNKEYTDAQKAIKEGNADSVDLSRFRLLTVYSKVYSRYRTMINLKMAAGKNAEAKALFDELSEIASGGPGEWTKEANLIDNDDIRAERYSQDSGSAITVD